MTEQIKRVESDESIIERLNDNFETLATMTTATSQGVNRSLICSGPPGIGKSECVERVLNNLPVRLKSATVSGNMKATGLYKMLYENRAKGTTVLIDDCDSLLRDEVSLNILKAATDSKAVRRITWGTETKMTDVDGDSLPRSFEFEGTVIILTNLDLAEIAESGTQISEHMVAMLSRSLYIDLGFNSKRTYFLRIRQVVQSGMLTEMGIDYTVEQDLLHYIETNLENLRELSLRMVLKLAGLIRVSPTGWKKLAKTTCWK